MIPPAGLLEMQIRRLALCRRDGLPTSSQEVKRIAELYGLGVSTVWRYIQKGEVPRGSSRERFLLSDEMKLAYFSHRGNASAAYESLLANGVALPGIRTFQRACKQQLTPAEKHMAKHGEKGVRDHLISLRYEAKRRNQIWQADHSALPMEVLFGRNTATLDQPWLTLFLDDKTRLIMGFAISQGPRHDVVLAAMYEAIAPSPVEGGEIGGIPDLMLWDNGLDFLSGPVSAACQALGIGVDHAPPYTPQTKGKVERSFRTIKGRLLTRLQGVKAGPKRRDGKAMLPVGDPMHVSELVEEVRVEIDRYNHTVHSALDGRSPVQAWLEDDAAVTWVDHDTIRPLLLAGETRKVHRDGIHFRNRIYVAAFLNNLVGSTVEIHHMVHDRTFIEVVADGVSVGRAYSQDELSESQRKEILSSRTASRKRAEALVRREGQRRKTRFAAATVNDPNPDVLSVAKANIAPDDELPTVLGETQQHTDTPYEAVRRLLDGSGENA